MRESEGRGGGEGGLIADIEVEEEAKVKVEEIKKN